MSNLTGQNVIILKEGTTRTKGRDALRNNIQAAKVIAESVRSALGPKGMDKMLVDSFGDVIITNDGATILKEIDVQHPGAKFVVDLAKTQDSEVGDGTTSVIVLAGEMLHRAEDLLDQHIHPSIIVEGFRLAREEALKLIKEVAIKVTDNERDTLVNIAKTSIASKAVKVEDEKLANLMVDAILAVKEEVDGKTIIDIDDIIIVKKTGESLKESELIKGIIIDKEVVHSDMPTSITDAKVLIVNSGLEISKTEFDAKLTINTPDDVQKFMDREKSILKEMANKIAKSGANVVICQKGIDDQVQAYLASKGILAIRRVKKSDVEKITKATGATIVTNLDDIEPEYCGKAGLVEQRKIAGDEMIFITETPKSNVVTILIRGGTDFVLEEFERSVHDGLCVVRNIVEDKELVAGGGAIEYYLFRKLEDFADKLSPKVQLAVKAFAQALLAIPRTLAENAGLDPIEMIGEINNKFSENQAIYGINPFKGVDDMKALGVLEPTRVKTQAISSAAEASMILLRIDDVVSAKDLGHGGGPGGAPDMPDDMDF
jgi:archaeal chaperonin